jgi:hypothetical protein
MAHVHEVERLRLERCILKLADVNVDSSRGGGAGGRGADVDATDLPTVAIQLREE